MNKRFIKYFWALPLLGMLSSCSESAVSEGSQNSRNAVQFAVTASKQTDSRATIVDNYLVKKQPFGLFAYYGTDWSTLVGSGSGPNTAPNFFNDQTVSHTGSGWTYSPLMFWTDDKVSFFGYWPKETGVTSASAVANEMPKVEFTQKMDAANMVDFITSNNAIDKTKNDGTVNLEFNHVLTRLNFFARADRDLSATTTKIYITGLRVLGSTANTASRFYNKATFVLGDGGTDGDGHWLVDTENGDKPTTETNKLDVSGILAKGDVSSTAIDNETTAAYQASAVTVDATGGNTELLSTVTATDPDDVDASGNATKRQNYLFMIPPRGKAGIQDNDIIVELDYDVVTENADINGLVDHRTGVKVPLKAGTLQQGKAYNIIFTVGLNVVNVDVNVTDWDTDEVVNAPEVDAQTSDESGIIAAWKNLNDIKASLKTGGQESANYFVINAKNMPGALDLRTNVDAGKVDLSAFDLGDQVELLFGDADGKKTKYASDVQVPNGWFYAVRPFADTERYILTKVTNYITKVADSGTADDIASALNALNTEKGNDTKGIHYYAVNIYNGNAPTNLDLSTATPAPTLGNFKDDDYIYIIFNSDNGATKTYTAPDGWEIVKTNVQGKYRLQKKVASRTSSIAIGNTGFVAGSTINVSK